MVRENLTAYPAGEQFAIELFERTSALTPESAWASGISPRDMFRPSYSILNKNLLTRTRWMEFLAVINKIPLEFNFPEDISTLFMQKGVDLRSGDMWELYLENQDFLNNYRIQVNLEKDAPFFLKVLAYTK